MVSAVHEALSAPPISHSARAHVETNFGRDFCFQPNGYLNWERKSADFGQLLLVKQLIDQDLPEPEFKRKIRNISTILLWTDIYKRLDSDKIQVSPAHKGVTPFRHSMRVLEMGKSDGLPPLMQRAVRWNPIWHDLAKLFGAKPPGAFYHSELSALIMNEFLNLHCRELGSELIDHMTFAVTMHHTSEGWKRWIDDGVVQTRLENPTKTLLLYLLSSADIWSIPMYQGFIFTLNQMIYRFQPEVYKKIVETGLLRGMPVHRNAQVAYDDRRFVSQRINFQKLSSPTLLMSA